MEHRPKLLYYCRVNRDDKANYGVIKKCQSQANGFRQLGFEVDMIWLCNEGILLNYELKVKFNKMYSPHTFRSYFFYYFFWHSQLIKLLRDNQYTVVYARYELSHAGLLKFFRFLKREIPTIQIILEVPTYPYSKELKGPLRRIQFFVDWICRGRLKGYVDRIVSYGPEKAIFGIPVISLANGIDLENLPVSNSSANPERIRLLALGNWRYWHGLDRLIWGMANYYKGEKNEVKVFLHIIGHGADLPQVLKLAQELGVLQYIETSAPLDGIALDKAFEEVDICVGDLASFRKGLLKTSSLKHREYCARAIPFFLSTPDDDFPKHLEWVYYIENSESPISIHGIVQFFQKISNSDYKVKMRTFAIENLSWKTKLGPLSDYLKQRLKNLG